MSGRSAAPIVMLTELADNTIKPRRINRRFKVRWTQKNLRQRHKHTHTHTLGKGDGGLDELS